MKMSFKNNEIQEGMITMSVRHHARGKFSTLAISVINLYIMYIKRKILILVKDADVWSSELNILITSDGKGGVKPTLILVTHCLM